MALFRLILLFFLIYLVLRFLGRLFFGVRQARQQANHDPFASSRNQRKEGDVSLHTSTQQKRTKRFDKNDGDYVKFEEVD